MKFTKKQSKHSGISFKASDRTEGAIGEKVQALEFDVHYSKGGMSYFNGQNYPRGVYFRIGEVTTEKTPYGMSMSFMIGARNGEWGAQSKSYLMQGLERGNAKAVERIAVMIEPQLEAISEAWRFGDMEKVKELVANPLSLKAVA